MTASRRRLLLAAMVALLQIGFLGWMIMGRAAILRDGREVLLKVEPVDPRDLLRGDYVRLGYEIGSVPRSLFANPPADISKAAGQPAFVRIAKQSDGFWRAIGATVGEPIATPAAPDQVDIRGSLTGYEAPGPDAAMRLFVDYGIDRFYLPEGEGLAIEKDMVVRPFGILAAIAGDGTRADQGAHGRRDYALCRAAVLTLLQSFRPSEKPEALSHRAAKHCGHEIDRLPVTWDGRTQCGCGGTGRRPGFRFQCREACGFNSYHPHHFPQRPFAAPPSHHFVILIAERVSGYEHWLRVGKSPAAEVHVEKTRRL